MSTKLILVGGFLGAGKTTLLARVARYFADCGSRVALITNDQSAHLVDTALLQGEGFGVGEVTGGCFCCRFDDLVAVADDLIRDRQPDILLGEPVGSCTDLSATVLQPFKKLHATRYDLAPFSVLVDPFRLKQVLQNTRASGFSDKVNYIFRKQLEEADLIVINKCDLLAASEFEQLKANLAREFPQTEVMGISALTGEGIEEWAERVSVSERAGRTVVPVDYDIYAEGEAELGWLNAVLRLTADRAIDWRTFCSRLMAELHRQFQSQSAEVAHLKISLESDGELLVGNLTRGNGSIAWRGHASPSTVAGLIVNARIAIDPQALRGIVESSIGAATGEEISFRIETVECFSPARPTPTHRFTAVHVV